METETELIPHFSSGREEVLQLCVIIPCYNEDEVIDKTATQVQDLLNRLVAEEVISNDSFMLFVDDGSNDMTWSKIKKLQSVPNSKIKALRFSKNFGHQSALLAGMQYCINKCHINICIDADLQHDISKIPDFIKSYKNGAEIVFGVKKRRGKESFAKKILSSLFYQILKSCRVNIIPNHADFRLMGRKATLALLNYKERNLFLRGLIPTLGFETDKVYYETLDRFAGESKYDYKKMISLAVIGITSQTILPLRLFLLTGFVIFILSIVVMIYVVYQKMIGAAFPGWASIVIPIYFLGGVQLMGLGILGEYLGKVYIETRQRPFYIVEEEV
jgi:glycosyltransferase involved in cell wall biosynthesis